MVAARGLTGTEFARQVQAAFCRWLLIVAVLTLPALQTHADDWPQWLGPNRDGRWRETGIVDAFPESGLKTLWRAPVAGGYSGPAVADGRVFVTDFVRESGELKNNPGQRSELQGKERVLCFDAKSGRELWKREYNCPYQISYACGPRATPTVDGDRVYTLGAEGHLLCLTVKNGEILWAKDLKKEYQTESPIWGFSGHPLVDGDRLVCLVGGEGSVAVAFDKYTGNEKWRALSASEPGYAPPTMIEAAGQRQLLIWHADAINALEPATGKVLWSQPLKPDYGMSIMAPRKEGDVLFASGIGDVGATFKLASDQPGAELIWRGDNQTAVYCANSTPIIDNGIIYGCDCRSGSLRAVKLETGERLWDTFAPTTGQRRAGHGTAFLVQHEDRYFLFSETGDLILAKLTPEGYEEISRSHIIEPTGEAFNRSVVWTHPAFANQCVFVRNDKELLCVSLAK
ncbi:MAG: PQQ-like beta-propeller repeat protein [Planctomycetales bacterium]|nr:PQQ-like beta-propeller repeat protein [Planctomycetales bacterium]